MPHRQGLGAAYAAWGVICIVWGTTFLANKVGLGSIPPLRLSGTRFLLAGLVLQGVVQVRRRRTGAPGVPWRDGPIGIITLGIGTGVVVWAQQWLPSGLTAVLAAVTPFWMVLLEAVIPGGTRPTRRALAGLVLGLAGIGVIAAQQPTESLRSEYLWAVGAVLAGGVGWSFGSIVTRRKGAGYDPLAGASAQMLWAGGALLALSFAVGERLPDAIDPKSLLALAYLVAFGSCLAFVSYLYALRRLPVAFVSTFLYVNPVLALWLGWLLLGEVLTPGIFVATGLIFGGLVLARGRRPPKADRPTRWRARLRLAPPKPAESLVRTDRPLSLPDA